MGRPIHADGRQTRQAILDAALDLFAEKGYFGTSLRDIAAVVGVRESAIYNYFKGKDALFIGLMTAAHEQNAEHVAGLLTDPAPEVRVVLERLAMLLLDDFCTTRQQRLFRVLMSDGMRLAKEGRINLIERMTSRGTHFPDLMRRLIAAGGLREGNPDLLAIEFMGPMLLWRHWHAIVPDNPLIANREAFVRHHVDQFLHGASAPSVTKTRRTAASRVTGVKRAPAGRGRARAGVAS